MKKTITYVIIASMSCCLYAQDIKQEDIGVSDIRSSSKNKEMKLIWSDEFNVDGAPDKTKWGFEHGFVRNKEDQWYQPDNAYVADGKLIIEALNLPKKECKNPKFNPAEEEIWPNMEYIEYTSSCLLSAGKFDFRYGTLEVRAKIPTASGAWPAIWLLGSDKPWPENGEIDVMEFYRTDGEPHILANACWGSDKPYTPVWDDVKIPFKHFTEKDPEWESKFHIWRMDWDEDAIRLYLDNELLNEISLSSTLNGSVGKGTNAMTNNKYILLNLAIGGINGGEIDDSAFPLKYEIDYVRVYK